MIVSDILYLKTYTRKDRTFIEWYSEIILFLFSTYNYHSYDDIKVTPTRHHFFLPSSLFSRTIDALLIHRLDIVS